jgi:hypothetical protein
MLFGYANVGSYGLGHSLLAWARCHLWCEKNHISMIAPSWLHIEHRIGPLLRRERDSRQYHRLFYSGDYISGWRRLWLLKTLQHFSAESDDLNTLIKDVEHGILVFRNQTNFNEESYFSEIVGRGHMLRLALEKITRSKFLPPNTFNAHIALHVRMGDFKKANSIDELRAGKKNISIPIDWFVEILTGLRERLGEVPAVVYSDGDDLFLADLLRLPKVVRCPLAPSITDMLSISRAAILISSGSGFSMWGSFLGEVPRICFPGQRFVRVLGEPHSVDFEPEVESIDELSKTFIDVISTRFNFE